MSSTPIPSRLNIASRVLASLLGGYGFVWGVAAFGIAALVAGGMDFEQARTLVMLLAFLVFLTVFCWAYVARSVVKVWALLAGGGLTLWLGAELLVRHLTA